ncbi:MAG TPA: lytic transglycosylase domain-containing protein [Sphingomicrobium sp.]|nr:lytic transglycosylase domain-containing protein [Sphingomicrobium sp.]
MDEPGRKAGGGALIGLLGGLLLAIPSSGDARSSDDAITTAADRFSSWQVDRWSPYIQEASARFGIPADWIRRVMRAESGGRTVLRGRPITSSAGAMGLMQLMPGTWAEMRAKHGLGPDPHHPRDNILAGAAYLRAMYDRFGYPDLFAAYNAGPTRYAEHLANGRRLPAETVAYVAAVGPGPRPSAAKFRVAPAEPGIFVSRLDPGSPETRPSPPDALFVRLSTASAAIE